MLWLDAYERRARLAPGLFALLSCATVIIALGLDKIPLASMGTALLSAAGGPVLLAAHVRQRGLAAQDQLWASKGGAPTTVLLRLRTASKNPFQRDLWRKAVEAVTKVRLLDEHEERSDPHAGDNAIEAAIARLRETTRGAEFRLIAAENKNYGFLRNLYGLRAFGRCVAASGSVLLASLLVVHLLVEHRLPFELGALSAGLAINLCLLLMWIVMPSKEQVWRAGEKYAHQLLQAAFVIESTTLTTNAQLTEGQ